MDGSIHRRFISHSEYYDDALKRDSKFIHAISPYNTKLGSCLLGQESGMKRKKLLPMARKEMEALSTKQLLARLKRLHQCEESVALSDQEAQDDGSSESIEFKDSSEWIAEYGRVKEVLAQRGHIPKGVELIEMRQEKARKGKSSERNVRMRRQ